MKKRTEKDIIEKALPSLSFAISDDTIKIKLPKEVNEQLWKWINVKFKADWYIHSWNYREDGCLYIKKEPPSPCKDCMRKFDHFSIMP